MNYERRTEDAVGANDPPDAREIIIATLKDEMCGACAAYREHEGYADRILAALDAAGLVIVPQTQLEQKDEGAQRQAD